MDNTKSVEAFVRKNVVWRQELLLLRETLLSCDLEETVKWGSPVYTFKGKNIVGLGAFKSYTGLWFFQGGLLADKQGKLVNAQEGKTKAMRQWRFSSIEEIKKDLKLIETYLKEAIQNQKQGKSISPERNKPVIMPAELRQAFKADTELQQLFKQLTLGRRRDFAEHIASAKRDETRQKRLAKIIPMIRAGIGLNDKYLK